MKAGVLFAKGDIRYADYPEPELRPGCVKVRVRAVGVCGSDIPRVWGDAAHFFPVVLGHEFSGEIVGVAEDVSGLTVGDRVTGAPLVPCMRCEQCQQGFYSQCKRYSFIGSREQGAFGQYVVMPAANAVKLPEGVSFEQGALIEPATVGLHGLFCAGYTGGEHVAVLGGGTIGLLTAQWARIMGARQVTVLDLDEKRLAVCREVGADHTVCTRQEGYLERAMALTGGKGFGAVFECAGAEATMNMAFHLAAPKAKVCFIGTTQKAVTFTPKTLELMNRKEFTLTGSWMSFSAPFPGREWALTAHYFATGQLKLTDSMIHRKLPLSAIGEGFDLFKTPGGVGGKVLFLNEDD
ncbi:MAG: galactitol-1-phosphate 5-dehydrogenase [Christensenellales bacterium]|jgi:L-iditol 2-dehydrogenase